MKTEVASKALNKIALSKIALNKKVLSKITLNKRVLNKSEARHPHPSLSGNAFNMSPGHSGENHASSEAGSVMTVLGLNHFNITAPPHLVEELKHFYVDIIGLTMGAKAALNHDGYWLYAVNSASSQPVLHLNTCQEIQASTDVRQGYFNHISLTCMGLVAAVSKLIVTGLPYQLTQVPSINLIQVFVKDPAGIGVELSFFNEDLAPLL